MRLDGSRRYAIDATASRSLRMLRAYIFLAGAGAGAAAAAALVLDFGAAAMGAAFAGLDAFALAGAFFAVFFGA